MPFELKSQYIYIYVVYTPYRKQTRIYTHAETNNDDHRYNEQIPIGVKKRAYERVR